MEISRKFHFRLAKYWVWCLTVWMILIFCSIPTICIAEDEELEISLLDEIEQDLINPSPGVEPQKIERKDLIKLEGK